MTIEAMKLALNALELCNGAETADGIIIYTDKEIASVRQAIEAAERQEPDELTIAYMSGFYDGKNKYAPRREWVGLTDEEIDVEALKDDHAAYFAVGAIWANKRLREKNNM